MSDITVIWDVDNSRGDWEFVAPALVTGNDLQSAVLISLFTDRIANRDDPIPDGTDDPRGWWGGTSAKTSRLALGCGCSTARSRRRRS